MKNSKYKFYLVAIGALFAAGCAATEYSSPSDVTKTGYGAGGTYFDATKTGISSFATATTPSVCNVATTVGDTNATTVSSKLSTSAVYSLNTPTVHPNGKSGGFCSEVQRLALATNPGDSVFKSVVSGTYTVSATAPLNNVMYVTRVFQADLDKDGSTDTVSYTVAFVGQTVSNTISGGAANANAIYINRSVTLTAANSTGAGAATTSTFIVANAGTAVLGTAGDHTFAITISGATSTTGSVNVVLDGTTVVDGAATATGGLDDATATIGTGTAGARRTTGLAAAGTAATLWYLISNTAIPVNAFNIVLYGKDTVTTGAVGSSFPSLKNLKIANQ